MPSTIRETLGERLRKLPGLARALEDLRLATGVPVQFVSALGHRVLGVEACGLCQHLHACPERARLCNRHLQGLLERAVEAPARGRCEAGLDEAAVPLRLGGQTFGWVVFGHSARRPPTKADLNQTRHLLERAGISIETKELERLTAEVPVMSPERLEAVVRIVSDLAERLVMEISESIVRPPEQLPALVERACRLVRAEYTQPLSLPACAQRLGVSSGHLSRTFHHSTGLRFVEYIARVRADHARRHLGASNESITEIAFACGFQSLSQFHRTMRAHFGCSPGELRERMVTSATPAIV
ncbi:MAG: helix-turn-helix domain-containing protein [Opitutales bacterium]